MNPRLARWLYWGAQALRGEPVARVLAELEESQRWTAERLQELERDRLRELLRYAYENVPFYRRTWSEAGFRAGDWRAEDALRHLPLVEKRHLQECAAEMRAPHAGGALLASTSGSSGTPVSVLRSHLSWAHAHANSVRALHWHGLEVGEEYVYFWGLAMDEAGRRHARVRDWFFNRVRCSAFELERPRVAALYPRLSRRRATHALGYASALTQFATELRALGLDGRALRWRAVISTSEVLRSHQRELLRETFGCPVVDSYGCAEAGVVGLECEQGEMHLALESVHVDLLDSEGVGGAREVALTDLHNTAQPLVRYRVGDLLIPAATHRCSCGRSLPLLGSVQGRAGDAIILPDGREVSPLVPYYVFKHYVRDGSVSEYQVAQYADGRLELRLRPGPGFEAARGEEIRAELSRELHAPVELRLVQRIERQGRGKHRDFVRMEEAQ